MEDKKQVNATVCYDKKEDEPTVYILIGFIKHVVKVI